MEKIYTSIDQLIGRTPLLELVNIEKKYNLKCRILGKLEFFNPAGSAKDRVAKNIIEDGEKKGLIKKGSVIIEPTSGNTGIGLASICASKGYRAIMVMPETMSKERIGLIKAYGAEVVLTNGALGMNGAIKKAQELLEEIPNSIIAGQFENQANPQAHYKSTGPEIWEDTNGNVDCFVAAVGTGGTITGTGKFLKEKNKNIKIIAVEPASSPVLSGGKAGPHKIQGIGAGFVPKTLDTEIYDSVITVSDDDALAFGREFGHTEGFIAGISSGAALKAAIEVGKRPEYEGKTIVVLFPDTGERYLSTELFS
ncbi:MAG: cysteine synthase A [Sphaerochaetaceae bacterium]|nr:cysteine synthase A [Sphaerochaetaceae bacterium]